jgi:hypothetical protein
MWVRELRRAAAMRQVIFEPTGFFARPTGRSLFLSPVSRSTVSRIRRLAAVMPARLCQATGARVATGSRSKSSPSRWECGPVLKCKTSEVATVRSQQAKQKEKS